MANPLIRYRAHITGPSGGPGLFTQYFDGGATPGTNEGTEAGARVRALFESIKADIVTAVTVVYDTGGDLIDPVTGQLVGSVGGTTPATTTCTNASDALPWATQGLIRKLTAGVVGGRRVNGHSFLPGLSESFNVLGIPTAGVLADMLTAANKLSTLVVTAVTPVVWHRPQGGGGGAAYSIVAYAASPKWAVLRSRRD